MSASSTRLNLNSLMILDIKCFQHCKASEKFLCLDLPEKCPTCLHNLNAKIKFKVPPFVLPKPLKLTNTRLKCLPPYSLLLQPTDCDYFKLVEDPDMSDLHIGVTNSDSDVYDFNQNGLNKNAHNWIDTPSIVIEIINPKNSSEMKPLSDDNDNDNDDDDYDYDSCSQVNVKWNMLLDRHWKRRKERWNRNYYDESRFNCLDFIICFLLEYGFFDLNQDNQPSTTPDYDFASESFLTSHANKKNTFILKSFYKQKLSKEFIEPEFLKCLRYLNLLINLNENSYLVERA